MSSVKFEGKYFKLNGANIKIPNLVIEKIPITVAAKKKRLWQLQLNMRIYGNAHISHL